MFCERIWAGGLTVADVGCFAQAAGKGVKCVTEQELMAMIDGSAAPVAKEEPEQEKAAARYALCA